MKKIPLLLTVLALAGTQAVFADAHPREIFWENALSAAVERPQDAITAFDELAAKAAQANAWGEYALAVQLRAIARASLEGRDSESALVSELQRAVADAPCPEAHAFLSARLALALQAFADTLEYGLLRPQTATAAGTEKDADVTTWPRERVLNAALDAYVAVFNDAEILKKIPIATLAAQNVSSRKLQEEFQKISNHNVAKRGLGIFSLNDSPAADFPTLYDFFAQDAATFYASLTDEFGDLGERAQNAKQNLLADWKAFHANDADQSARARATLTELNLASTPDKAALEKFTEDFAYYPIAAEAFYALAKIAIDEDRREEAFLLAGKGYEKYKQHKNAVDCAELLEELSLKDVSRFSASNLWFDAESAKIKVSAKNIDKLYFRAVPWDWQDFLRRERNRPNNLSTKETREILLSEEGAVTWSQELEKFTDFAEHEFTVAAPFEKLEPGFYFIGVSADPDFASFGKDRIPYLTTWVSNISVVTRRVPSVTNAKEKRTLHGYVVNATTGEPLENVEIAAWNKVYGGDRVPVESVTTKADGTFELPGVQRDCVALAVAPDGNAFEIDWGQDYSNFGTQNKALDEPIGKLFTDRAIYRPGQVIHFKGIRARGNAEKINSYKLLPGEAVTVFMEDANGRIVAQTECYPNAFGSFAGTFTAPSGLLNGRFTIHFDSAIKRSIAVEEYKRPKFEVELKEADQYILGQNVRLNISAKALTGMPLDNAQVEWSVTSYDNRRFRGIPQAVANGKGVLNADGTATIAFPTEVKKLTDREARKLSPSEKLAAERKLTRNYQIKIAVTDSTGETRELEKTVTFGNCALKALLNLENDDSLSARIETHDGRAVAVPVTFAVYERVLPEKISRSTANSPWLRHPGKQTNNELTRGKKLFETTLTSSEKNGFFALNIPEGTLPKAGAFIAVLSGKDAFARPFENEITFTQLDAAANRCPVKLPFILKSEKTRLNVGETFSALWGSGHESARARVEIFKNGKYLRSFWTEAGNTQQVLSVPVTPDLVGGFSIQVSQLRNGTFHEAGFLVDVPQPDKTLNIAWERFRTKLVPGGAEVWTARVTLPDGTPANAEMLALLYDRSLDSLAYNFQPYNAFTTSPNAYRHIIPNNMAGIFPHTVFPSETLPQKIYEHAQSWTPLGWLIPSQVTMPPLFGNVRQERAYGVSLKGMGGSNKLRTRAPRPEHGEDFECEDGSVPVAQSVAAGEPVGSSQAEQAESSPVTPRKNLQETAFFQAFINTDASGIAQLTFVVPEALTGWHFLAFAHDKNLRSGKLESTEIVTEKPLMAQANPPRFLREGDRIQFPVKITNSGKTPLQGKAQLAFERASDCKDVFAELCNDAREQSFSVPAGGSQTLLWEISVPEDCDFLTYRATARANAFSDGEEALLPVLPKTVTVTESANFAVRPGKQRTEKLVEDIDLFDKKFKSLSIRVNDNPVWDAALALPKLALLARENDSSDSIFYRFYTNKLAEFIANSDPAIRKKFEALTALGNDAQELSAMSLWKIPRKLNSPLAQDKAKNIALEATPYVQDANDETAQRRTIAVLFDKNTMAQESLQALSVLRERANDLNGDGWSWFPGAQEVSYVTTRTILVGLARLRDLGAIDAKDCDFRRAVIAQDKHLSNRYNTFNEAGERIPKAFSADIAEHLYMRSLYLADAPIGQEDLAAWQHYLAQAKDPEIWTKLSRSSQGRIALALARAEPASDVPARIVESLRQYATKSDELGMYWKDDPRARFWCFEFAPIETHALMIEVFAKIAKNEEEVAALKMWLLTQKQAQAWRASRASAEAVFALLCTPEKASNATTDNALSDEDSRTRTSAIAGTQMSVSAGKEIISGDEKTFRDKAIVPAITKLSMKNTGKNPAFVSAVWTYEAPVDSIQENAPPSGFQIRKTLWKKMLAADGRPTLFPIRPNESLAPGDEVVVRLVIETDRDFEFVHLKDLRGSGCEPTGTRSGYRWNNGIWYYATTRDTAEHFFFDRLPRGKHVFEYSQRVVHRGVYSAGFAEIRSLYAPEFSAHSKAARISTR